MRTPQLCQHQGGRRLKLNSMVNTCELLQRRYNFKLKVADKLAPKGKWSGIYAEHGNPVLLHLSMETKP